uniref:Uncharacterized protein n=1 Tax=Oryza rufipogon TaxID=4529 RepID=A0A0E0Q4W0_ORYRU
MRGSDLQHHPKSFLIKFEHRRRHAEALKKGFPSAVGLSFILFKWHKSVLSIALMFCVHLYLDARTCVLKNIEMSFIHSSNTRWINIRAWTSNPNSGKSYALNQSSIPKRVWIIFTSSRRGNVLHTDCDGVRERPQERSQHAVKYCMYVHLEEIYGYASATVTLDDKPVVAPSKASTSTTAPRRDS